MLENLKKDLHLLADKEKALFFPRFFKTGTGQYGEGDIFISVNVPNIRLLSKKYRDLTLKVVQKLLNSKIHEERLLSIFILVSQFKKGDLKTKEEIYNFYLSNTKFINNWDLVDASAANIVGKFQLDNPNYLSTLQGRTFEGIKILEYLANSENVWDRRIAIISTFEFINNKRFKETLEISKILLNDKHDLIHKAVGWMLREVGKKDVLILKIFLKDNYRQIPRTTLRYALEKFTLIEKQNILKGKFS